MTRRTLWPISGVVLAVLAAMSVAACGGGSSGSTNAAPASGSTGDATGSTGDASRPRFVRVSFFPTSDPTGAVIDKGQTQAAKDLGVDVEYRAPADTSVDPAELKRLLESAIATKPSGIIFTDLVPQALNPIVKKATDAGIPVILSYVSPAEAAGTGALTVVGNDDVQTGRVGAEKLNALGSRHALMVTIPPGIPFIDKRATGFGEAFEGKVTKLALPVDQVVTDPAAARNAMEATLQKDSSIDAVFTLGTLLTPPMVALKSRLGSRASRMKWGAVDANPVEVEGVKSGALDFSLDSQPYQWGYLPVTLLTQYVRYGITPAFKELPTGPVVVDRHNVDKVAALVGSKK